MKKFAIALVAMLVVMAMIIPAKAGDAFEEAYKAGVVASAVRPFEDSTSSPVGLSVTPVVVQITPDSALKAARENLACQNDPELRKRKERELRELEKKVGLPIDENPYEPVYPVGPVNNLLPAVPIAKGYSLFLATSPLGYKKLKELVGSSNGGHNNLRFVYSTALGKIGVVISLDSYLVNGFTMTVQGNDYGREHKGVTFFVVKFTLDSKDHRNVFSVRVPDLAFVPYEGPDCDSAYMIGWAVEVSKLISTHYAGIAPTFDPIHNPGAVARFKEPGKIVDALYYAPQPVVAAPASVAPPVDSGPPYSCIVIDREKPVKRLTITSNLSYKVECSGEGYAQGYSTSVLTKGGKVSVQVTSKTVVKVLFSQNGTLTSRQVWPQ